MKKVLSILVGLVMLAGCTLTPGKQYRIYSKPQQTLAAVDVSYNTVFQRYYVGVSINTTALLHK